MTKKRGRICQNLSSKTLQDRKEYRSRDFSGIGEEYRTRDSCGMGQKAV